MTSYAAIMLNTQNLPAVLDSLSGAPGAGARFFHACLTYPYAGDTLYFVRGNYKNSPGIYGFDDHIFTRRELEETFTHNLKIKVEGRTPRGMYGRNPDAQWFLVSPKKEYRNAVENIPEEIAG